jgi:ethanolamine phosphate phosphodiesterase
MSTLNYRSSKQALPIYNDEKSQRLSVKQNNNLNLLKSNKNTILYLYTLVVLSWLYTTKYFEVNYVNNAIKSSYKDEDTTKLLVFGDVQIMDKHSYPNRPYLVNKITQLILDNYHRKNWISSQNIIKPQYNVFMGDLFDGGRYWDNQYWLSEFERFHKIFKKVNIYAKNLLNLPGNHDIGFGDTILKDSFYRFNKFFGNTNSRIEIKGTNYVIYTIDSIALSDSKAPEIQNLSIDYLNEVKNYHNVNPLEKRILLTHVPLFRDPNTQVCGALRESKKPFPIVKGNQYQTVISSELTDMILDCINPDLVLSGDDHDYCEITHSFNNREVKEITTKSAAMNMGIQHPQLTLLTIDEKDTLTYSQIDLHTPYMPLLVYGMLSVLSVLYLFFYTFRIEGNDYRKKNMKLFFYRLMILSVIVLFLMYRTFI